MSLDLDRFPDSVWAKIRVLRHLHIEALLAHDHLVLHGHVALSGSVLLKVREVDGALARIQGVLKRFFGFDLFYLE